MITYRDIADTEAMIAAAQAVPARGGDRRRAARARSGQRPQAARHGRDGRAPDAVADGAPARPHRGEHAAAVARSEGTRVPARGEDRGAGRRRERPRRRGAARRRRNAAGGSRRDGGGHPAQRRARAGGGAALRPRHRRQRHAADVRSAHLRDRRVREPSRHRPTAWSRRCSRWRRSAPTISRSYGIGRYAGSQTSTKLKVTGVDLFSAGDFTGGADTEEIVLADPAAASTRSW